MSEEAPSEKGPKEAYLYQTRSGFCPFEEWLASLTDRKAAAAVRARIARCRAGNLGHCRPVGHGVSEMKIDFGPGLRVYFGEVGRTIVILLCGGVKKSQKRDIEAAQAYWADYWERGHEARKALS